MNAQNGTTKNEMTTDEKKQEWIFLIFWVTNNSRNYVP